LSPIRKGLGTGAAKHLVASFNDNPGFRKHLDKRCYRQLEVLSWAMEIIPFSLSIIQSFD
jgi:hypothetical protein